MKLAQSQQVNLLPPSGFSNLTNLSFQNLVTLAINFVLIITAIILFFMLLGGGVAYMLGGASGNAQQAGKGTQAITGALIGLIIVFGAWAIMNIIENFFGVNLMHLNIP